MDLSRAIVSFKAGRALRRGDTNWVDPAPTKGLVSVSPSDDGLLHFYWANRESNSIEEVRSVVAVNLGGWLTLRMCRI